MMDKFKKNKYWYKLISLLLTFVLSVNLFAGCTGSKSGVGEDNITSIETSSDVRSSDDTGIAADVHDTAGGMSDGADRLNEALDNLAQQLEKGDIAEADSLYNEVKVCLDITDEEAQSITDVGEAENNLSEEAKTLLKQRAEAFQEVISDRCEKVDELSSALSESFEKSDVDTSLELIEEIKGLTEEKTEIHTYGETALYEKDSSSVKENICPKKLQAESALELSDEIKITADKLDTPLQIYNYIKNNFDYDFYCGSKRGVKGTFDAKSGNDIDHASLLIAMLRYKGYQAKYVYGDIVIDAEQAIKLTGAANADIAADILAQGGTRVEKQVSKGRTVSIKLEHVWVRTCVPYTDYRGAGDASGDMVWIDLDTGIKMYEKAESIYDYIDEAELPLLENGISSGNNEIFEELCEKNTDKIEEGKELYAKRYIIKKKDEIYLPLSLPYDVKEEKNTYEEIPNEFREYVTIDADGIELASFYMDELCGRNITLSFEGLTEYDKEIIAGYGDIFGMPVYAAFLSPVIYIDDTAINDTDEELIAKNPGSQSILGITYSGRAGRKSVRHDITTGSIYHIAIDNQSVSDIELEETLNDIKNNAGKPSTSNVYSRSYLGRYLAAAGKLYFAQIDLCDYILADAHDVVSTREYGEALVGYEVEKRYSYGILTGIKYGQMFIDVDLNIHNVKSRNGNRDAEKEYLFKSGILSSAYESTVWEEITGEKSISTVAVLEAANEQSVELLAIKKQNLETELAGLDTTDDIENDIRTSVNAGMLVIIPEHDITIGKWSGNGYIILNPETGAGTYRISGGLNGGSTDSQVDKALLVECGLTLVDILECMSTILKAISIIKATEAVQFASAGMIGVSVICIGLSVWAMSSTYTLYEEYCNGSISSGKELVKNAKIDIILTIATTICSAIAKPIINMAIKNKLIKELGKDVVENLLKSGESLADISKRVKYLKQLGLTEDLISEFADKYGMDGLEWLRKVKSLSTSADNIRLLMQMDDFADRMDEIYEMMKNSSRTGDEVVYYIFECGEDAYELLVKYGDEAADNIILYGDVAINLIGKYGDEAVDGFSQGKSVFEIDTELGTKAVIEDPVVGNSKFAENIDAELKKNGLTLKEFNDLRLKEISKLTAEEKAMLKAIRESVPMPDADTLMQKVIPLDDVKKYIDGKYGVRGFMSRYDDVKQLDTYEKIYDNLRLDYSNSPYKPNKDDGLAVIRFKTSEPKKICVPYGPDMGGTEKGGFPFSGNGFTRSTSGQIIPEFRSPDDLELEDGAQIIEIRKGEADKVIAVYDGEKFAPCIND